MVLHWQRCGRVGRRRIKLIRPQEYPEAFFLCGVAKEGYHPAYSNLGAWEEIDSVKLVGSTSPSSSAPIPEPSSMLLIGSGLIALAAWSRKKS
jgi:hypothetical protein